MRVPEIYKCVPNKSCIEILWFVQITTQLSVRMLACLMLAADGTERIICHKDSTTNLPKVLKLHKYAVS
jgi:hypothetical protein